MATLIPSYNSCASRMTSGEKRLAQRLEAKLEDDYLLWYDVPVGPKCLHPDFILLHPSQGFFVLEVKDWKLETIQSVNPETFKISTSPHGAIKLMTMHTSKGLEFPVVFIPGLGYLPNAQGAIADEARLLYVAMTRAIEILVLTGDRKSVFVERLKTALANVI